MESVKGNFPAIEMSDNPLAIALAGGDQQELLEEEGGGGLVDRADGHLVLLGADQVLPQRLLGDGLPGQPAGHLLHLQALLLLAHLDTLGSWLERLARGWQPVGFLQCCTLHKSPSKRTTFSFAPPPTVPSVAVAAGWWTWCSPARRTS